MRITLAIIAAVLVALGLWLAPTGFMAVGPPATITGPQMSATPRTTAGPIAIGTALLIGGGMFFLLLLRRR
ncbi:hypothetical protein BH20VER1_BH20VER1_13940 [soil metagenome]